MLKLMSWRSMSCAENYANRLPFPKNPSGGSGKRKCLPGVKDKQGIVK
jgi:hypothetical protein